MMRFIRFFAVAALLSLACGDDGAGPPDDGGNNNDPDPVPTAVGTPTGAFNSATIGAAGGSVSSEDNMVTVVIPAGALAADTEIGVETISNEAHGGIGLGYRLSPDGHAFNQPVQLVFALDPDTLLDSSVDVLDIAMQRDDNTWGIPRNQVLDEDEGTLTVTTSHFSDYSMTEGVQLRPRFRVLQPQQTTVFTIRLCLRIPTNDPDLTHLLIECDEDLIPLGTATNWSANGVVGGNGEVGTISPTTGPQATYGAPTTAPAGNPVTITVRFQDGQAQRTLRARVRIAEEVWRGEISAIYPGGDKFHALLDFTPIGTFDNLANFVPEGPITKYELAPSDCAFVSLTPDNYAFDSGDGLMQIDYTQDPPTVFIGIGTFWPAQTCYQCPDHPVQCAEISLIVGIFFEDVLLGPNQDVIEGLGVVTDDVTYTYRFEKVLATQ